MKIAISGAHNVGKTTLAGMLQEALSGYEHRMEPYDELEESGYAFSDPPGFDDYLAQLEHSIQQLSTEETHVIFDRCPLDLLAYIQATGAQERAEDLYREVQKAMAVINLLVFVPIEEPDRVFCPDHEQPGLREDVDALLRDWIADLDIKTITVSGTPEQRKKQVLAHMAG